jgi:hypothetical protein
VWGGHVPLSRVAGAPVADAEARAAGVPVPPDVVRRAAAL